MLKVNSINPPLPNPTDVALAAVPKENQTSNKVKLVAGAILTLALASGLYVAYPHVMNHGFNFSWVTKDNNSTSSTSSSLNHTVAPTLVTHGDVNNSYEAPLKTITGNTFAQACLTLQPPEKLSQTESEQLIPETTPKRKFKAYPDTTQRVAIPENSEMLSKLNELTFKSSWGTQTPEDAYQAAEVSKSLGYYDQAFRYYADCAELGSQKCMDGIDQLKTEKKYFYTEKYAEISKIFQDKKNTTANL